MKTDILEYCKACDICQKTKFMNFNKYGYLIPNPIPSRPYQLIAMDFIVNLPWSNGFNAIFVVVDRLSKQGTFITSPYHSLSYNCGLALEGDVHSTT